MCLCVFVCVCVCSFPRHSTTQSIWYFTNNDKTNNLKYIRNSCRSSRLIIQGTAPITTRISNVYITTYPQQCWWYNRQMIRYLCCGPVSVFSNGRSSVRWIKLEFCQIFLWKSRYDSSRFDQLLAFPLVHGAPYLELIRRDMVTSTQPLGVWAKETTYLLKSIMLLHG